MTQSARFCSNCGAPLSSPDVRFCGQCGQSVRPQAAPAQPEPSPAPQQNVPASGAVVSEPVLGVIAYTSKRRSLFKSDAYNLVVTPRRIILAAITDQMIKDAAARALEDAKAQGKGMLARTGAVWGSRAALWQRYLSMPVEAILAEQPGNTFIALEQIKSVKVDANYGDDDNLKDSLTIDAASGKTTFVLGDTSANDARKLLKQVLGNRVR